MSAPRYLSDWRERRHRARRADRFVAALPSFVDEANARFEHAHLDTIGNVTEAIRSVREVLESQLRGCSERPQSAVAPSRSQGDRGNA